MNKHTFASYVVFCRLCCVLSGFFPTLPCTPLAHEVGRQETDFPIIPTPGTIIPVILDKIDWKIGQRVRE